MSKAMPVAEISYLSQVVLFCFFKCRVPKRTVLSCVSFLDY